MRGRRGVAVIAAAAVAAGCAGYALSITGLHAQTALGGPGVIAGAVQIAAVTLLAAVGTAGLFGRDGRTTSLALLAAAVVACLAVPPPEGISNSVWFTAALATAGAFGPTLICVALCWPAPARTSAGRVAILVLVPITLTGLAPTLLFRPGPSGCTECAENLLAVTSAPGARDAIRTAGEIAAIAGAGSRGRPPGSAGASAAHRAAGRGAGACAGSGIALVTIGAAWHELSLPTEETDWSTQLRWSRPARSRHGSCSGSWPLACSTARGAPARRLVPRLTRLRDAGRVLRRADRRSGGGRS